MGHTQPPLRIGFNGTGSANHDEFDIEIDETVPVIVTSPCSVEFKPKGIFIDQDYKDPASDEWIPIFPRNITVKYRICPYKGVCPPWKIENTYSVKIGSGMERKRKRKSRRRPAAKTGGKTAKKRTKSSLRRRK